LATRQLIGAAASVFPKGFAAAKRGPAPGRDAAPPRRPSIHGRHCRLSDAQAQGAGTRTAVPFGRPLV